jgi:hypothetical protein
MNANTGRCIGVVNDHPGKFQITVLRSRNAHKSSGRNKAQIIKIDIGEDQTAKGRTVQIQKCAGLGRGKPTDGNLRTQINA